MGYGYSLDLREKLIAAWQNRGLSTDELAELFGVGTATVKRWKRRYRETGSVEALAHGGGHPLAISEEQLPIIEELVKRHPDWTEEEYTEHLVKEHGLTASRSAVGRTIRRLGYSVKKRPSPQRRRTVQMLDEDESNTCETSETSPLHVWFLWTKRARTSR
jgi:transposase